MYRPNLQSVALPVPKITAMQFWVELQTSNLGEGETVGGQGW